MRIFIFLPVFLLVAIVARAESSFLKEFDNNYDLAGMDYLNTDCEVADVSDFTYQKDIATFTFTKGQFFFVRYLMGRPTTAFFVGEGRCDIEIPNPNEVQSLIWASGKPAVHEKFQVLFIRFADDLDTQLREKFSFRKDKLSWRDYNTVKQAQGEFFFNPVVMHEYDNYFELMRSLYERRADGYFWADFNRYSFTFDPNRPEEVIVSYEKEGGTISLTDGAVLARKEKGKTTNAQLSQIAYPLTTLSRIGTIEMEGLDGKAIKRADVEMKVLVNADSLRFVSLYLHRNLGLDSLFCNGRPTDIHRRVDFSFIGAILPEYHKKGDTLTFRFVYHGKNYFSPLPFVEDPSAATHNLTFIVPKGYNYIVPGRGEITMTGDGHQTFVVAPAEPMQTIQFQPIAGGYDTIPVVTGSGLTLNFLKSSNLSKSRNEHFVDDAIFRSTVTNAFDFMTTRLGQPNVLDLYVYPEEVNNLPGLIPVTQVMEIIDGTSGLNGVAAPSVARQWFGGMMRPATDREIWLLDGATDYLGLMSLTSTMDGGMFFGELQRRRNELFTELGMQHDMPLADGRRTSSLIRTIKGCWLMHQLRYLMYDTDKQSDRKFILFLRDLLTMVNTREYTNDDIQKLAEQHYGSSLDWFFNQWLYGIGLPECDVTYTMGQSETGSVVNVEVNTKKVGADFAAPVMMRVALADGTSVYARQTIKPGQTTFQLGPYASAPTEFVYNEFFSLLAKDNVKKK